MTSLQVGDPFHPTGSKNIMIDLEVLYQPPTNSSSAPTHPSLPFIPPNFLSPIPKFGHDVFMDDDDGGVP